jgi:hypothetical protein
MNSLSFAEAVSLAEVIENYSNNKQLDKSATTTILLAMITSIFYID